MLRILLSLLLTFLIFSSCVPNEAPINQKEWAIAIHGGAGVISKDIDPKVRAEYEEALAAALNHGKMMLENGTQALDVVEHVINMLENDPHFNAGKGAVMTADGTHELDASIMDGSNLACGAVAGVKTVKNPISIARKVMTETSHVLLAGEGADLFAKQQGVELVPNDYFTTEKRKKQLEASQKSSAAVLDRTSADYFDYDKKGTVGCVVLDKKGNLAAGTSTGGMTNKKHGRVGDAPIIGAGTYADNNTCAISATGSGEEFIRFGVARDISAIMEYKKVSLKQAADEVIFNKLAKGDGGVIAVSHTGEIAMPFNSLGMFRGAADSEGLYTVKIWED